MRSTRMFFNPTAGTALSVTFKAPMSPGNAQRMTMSRPLALEVVPYVGLNGAAAESPARRMYFGVTSRKASPRLFRCRKLHSR
jgi:hypothetical protein